METTGLNNSVQNNEQFNDSVEATSSSVSKEAADSVLENSNEEKLSESVVDFSEEDALLDANRAGLDLEPLQENEEDDLEEDDVTDTSSDEAVSSSLKLTGKNKEQLIGLLKELIETKPIQTIRKDIDAIKVAFYKIHRNEVDTLRKKFYETHEETEPFTVEPDHYEAELKRLFGIYRTQRDVYMQNIEKEKEENYQKKLRIIEELKKLVNGGETLNHTFNVFRDLQNQWKESGPVPKNHVKDLWETYHLHVENFYNFIKINKELRDLDLKKNYEAKIALCEEAEALLLEKNITVSFRKLQKLHDEWREIGPVALEYKEPLWDRFKNASSQINKRHQEYFDQIKEEQKRNLELKTALCERAEALVASEPTTRKGWEKASEELIEIQKLWKNIGFAPKKDNNKIYERFREICDRFFEVKRRFYLNMKEEMDNNLQAKISLCISAEAIAQSSEWKKSTEELLALQKQWKEIGPVPRKQSEAVWKRFRAACDTFFNRKGEYYAGLDQKYEENLAQKRALLEELTAFDVLAAEDGFEALKAYQRRWSEIGFVPMKEKDALQKEYRKIIDALFNTLRSGDKERKIERFRERMNHIKGTNAEKKIFTERDRLYNKIKQLENDITLWENNIGFFAKSKNAQAMIDDVNHKIARAKEEIAVAIEKIKIIDAE